jgi:hypothetical protein
MTSSEIQHILRINYNHDYVLENQYVFYWESDYFGITKTGYVWEIEVKISVSDFKADFQKNFKHRCLIFNKQNLVSHEYPEVVNRKEVGVKFLANGRPVRSFIDEPQGYCRLTYGKSVIPNRFYYAAPEEIAYKVLKMIPKYAGLLSINERNQVVELKKAPLLHKKKLLEELKGKLLSKFYWLSERQRKELRLRQMDLKFI